MNEPEDPEETASNDAAFALVLKSLQESMRAAMNLGTAGCLYTLEGHTPVPCDDFMTWAMLYEDRGRVVQQDQIGEYWISTVFLGMNTRLWGGPPVLFESMVFLGEKSTGADQRYSTWDEAVAGHARICAALRESG